MIQNFKNKIKMFQGTSVGVMYFYTITYLLFVALFSLFNINYFIIIGSGLVVIIIFIFNLAAGHKFAIDNSELSHNRSKGIKYSIGKYYLKTNTGQRLFSTSSIIKNEDNTSMVYHDKPTKFNFGNYILPINDNSLLSTNLLKICLNKFWKDVVEKIEDDQHILLLVKIKYSNGQFSTIDYLKRLNKIDKGYLLDQLINMIEIKSNYYLEIPITNIIFNYGIRPGNAPIKPSFNLQLNYHNYRKYNLPIETDPLNYGIIMRIKDNEYTIQINDTNVVIINVDPINKTNVVKLHKKGKLSLQWKDIILEDNIFIREIGKNKFTFKNNELILSTVEKTVKFISKVKTAKKRDNKFITLDIETMVVDNKHIPYCMSIFDGAKSSSFFLKDFTDSTKMIRTGIETLLKRKYDNHKIYIHNLSNFDGIFLLKILVNVGIISPIINNGRIIQIQLNYGPNLEYVIYFRDSYQILLASLRKLGKSFNVNTQKGIFPYKFPNLSNLEYVGSVPDFNHFENISYTQYILYKIKYLTWSLREETIKYCEKDCISLFEIIKKFNDRIYNKWSLNINNYTY